MVLKKKILLFSLLSFSILNFVFSLETEFWQQTLQTAFSNSITINRIINEYSSTLIQKKQYDYSWFPVIQAGLQESLNIQRGDNLYVLNQTPDSSFKMLMSPAASLSVIQKLPGRGQLSFTADYAFSWLTEQNAFIQFPQLQLKLNQSLTRGAFGITKDTELLLIREQLSYSRLIMEKNLFEELKSIINLLSSADILLAQKDYYKALAEEYKSQASTAKNKEKSGLQSGLQSFYAEHQTVEAENKLNELSFKEKDLLKNLYLILPDFDIKQINDKRIELADLIQEISGKLTNYFHEEAEKLIEQNLDSQIYSNSLRQYNLQKKNEDKNSAPVLYFSSTLKTDNNFYNSYSDWFKSFRSLNQSPYPIDFSVAVGIQKTFELSSAKKLRNDIYRLYSDSITKEMQIKQVSQKGQLFILLAQIEADTKYIKELKAQLESENTFRIERAELLSKGLITQDEFYKGESLYFLIYSDYIQSFWKTVDNYLELIKICNGIDTFMIRLLGDNYEKLF
ncbi:MAG: hypothetical protein IK024_06170 [Treponema sp.]|nr:hypothetical protein [Treponema sp.]